MADDEDAAKDILAPMSSSQAEALYSPTTSQHQHVRTAQVSTLPQNQGATPKHRSAKLPLGVIPLPPGSRGPRSLYLRRQENGFGFTLRHFIVYPPEPLEDDGSGGFVEAQPMDTIFVKRVVEGGAGSRAGLKQGDRIVAVNGQSINGLTYAQVVGLIKRSPPYLHLLVVSQKDDVLQKYFGETAHNPETNQRYPQEQHSHHKRHFVGLNRSAMIPQSPTATSTPLGRTAPSEPIQEMVMHPAVQHPNMPVATNYYQPIQENIYNVPHDNRTPRTSLSEPQQGNTPVFHNIYAEPYQRSRAQPQIAPSSTRSSGTGSSGGSAQPQVPVTARPSIRRHSVRRLSEGSCISDSSKDTRTSYESGDYCSINSERFSCGANSDNMVVNIDNCKNEGMSSMNICNNSELYKSAGCRLSLDADERRHSMNSTAADGSKDSLSSFGSSSTLTGQETDDSVIMSRLRKNFEKKEAFLRRPSKPTGFLETPEGVKLSSNNSMVIQREFYGRPQKLQKPIWPPLTSGSNLRSHKPLHQDFERIKSDLNIEKEFCKDKHSRDDRYDSDQCYMSDSETQYQSDGLKLAASNAMQKTTSQRDKNSFSSTLSRIHENIPSTVTNFGAEDSNGTSSNSSECQLSDSSSPYPAVVWKRTRQFESGRAIPDDEMGPINDRTSLYSSELARLSSKRVVPNVAVRKREFETRTEELSRELRRERESLRRLAHKENKSLESADSEYVETPPSSQFRARSNSTGSWSLTKSMNDSIHMDSDMKMASGGVMGRHRTALDWRATQTDNGEDDKHRHKAVRQDSYLAAVRGHLVKSTVIPQNTTALNENDEQQEFASPASIKQINSNKSGSNIISNSISNSSNITITVTPSSVNKTSGIVTAIRPTHLPINEPFGANIVNQNDNIILHIDDVTPDSPDVNSPPVIRRNNLNVVGDEERATRRVSYLKATLGEPMLMESEMEASDSDDMPRPQVLRSSSPRNVRTPSPITTTDKENHCPMIKEGALNCKITLQDGKRATDRSWKQIWAVLNKDSQLILYNYRHYQSPMGLADMNSDVIAPALDVRYSVVEVADDYTKRKNVFRVSSISGAEILLQADTTTEMLHWVRALQQQATNETEEEVTIGSKQQAVPQQVPAGTSIQVQGATRLSPLPGHKSIRKLTSFRNRSPTGQSPVNKTRKSSSSQAIENLPSPKSKTWGRVVKQFRKIHHSGAGSPNSPTGPEEGATIGIPLELCPPSTISEYIPLLVETCTRIVEERGLDVIGIYRVPGNTAAITLLTEDVNKGFTSANLQDPRWNDVNVVSSLLKSFFRRLPDSLFTTALYPKFIEADKVENSNCRMVVLRKLLNQLPDHHYETLKYLMLHLKRIVEHSQVNKMEARNLAIVFGPTLVRAGDDNMVTMVTDMQHQCRIIESLLCHVDWFFSDDEQDNFSIPPSSIDKNSLDTDSTTSVTNHNLLLNNIDKIEGMKSSSNSKDVAKGLKSTIISAAHRKIQKNSKSSSQQRIATKSNYLEAVKTEMDRCSDSTDGELTESDRTQHGENTESIPTTVIDLERKSNETTTQQFTSGAITTTSTTTRPAYRPILNIANGGTIRSYTGLSATTQERIRKFEQETRAMLARRRLEEDKRRNEMEWSTNETSKVSLSNDQLLNRNSLSTIGNEKYSLSKNTTSSSSSSNILDRTKLFKADEKLRYNTSDSYLRYSTGDTIDPRSRCSFSTVLQSGNKDNSDPSSNRLFIRRGSSVENVNNFGNEHSNNGSNNVSTNNLNSNGTLKRFKTGKEMQIINTTSSSNYNVSLQQRYGSLDSLDKVHNNESRRSTDLSDDGSDLLTSLTTTFDKKLKSLLNPSSPVPLAVDDNIPYFDESPEHKNPTSSSSSNDDELSPVNKSFTLAEPPFKLFRNPSLHKNTTIAKISSLKKENLNQSISQKLQKEVVEKEKDEDSKEGNSGDNESIPDNDRFVREKQNLSTIISNLEHSPSKTKLKRSESLNKTDSNVKLTNNTKLKRSESLNRSANSEMKNEKLHRVDSLTKTEKTECNISKKRELGTSTSLGYRKSFSTKLKRKNGMPERSIKRRHTVGGTKDFDKVHWLDNRLHNQTEHCTTDGDKTVIDCCNCDKHEKPLRTSSPDLTRRERFLLEVNLLGPEGMIVALRKHLVGTSRPHSLPESRVYKVPLESHV